MAFGDRTAEFASVAQTLRNKGLKPLSKRKDTVYTARMNINRLAAEIGKDTHATSRKLEVLTRRTRAETGLLCRRRSQFWQVAPFGLQLFSIGS
jgi:hypothetical protein